MEPIKVLLVEDEAGMRELVRLYLEREGYQVHEVAEGREALALVEEGDFQLVILDIMLPGLDGWSICRQLRSQRDIPIIILTARGDELDRVLGFELGADDYVVKPFSPRELVARVKALLRRAGVGGKVEKGEGETIAFAGLELDLGAREVLVQGEQVTLTPKEFDLLSFLALHRGKVFTREQLLEQVWGYDFFGDLRTVDTHIKNLREKLGKRDGAAGYLKTVWGVGYKFEVGKGNVQA